MKNQLDSCNNSDANSDSEYDTEEDADYNTGNIIPENDDINAFDDFNDLWNIEFTADNLSKLSRKTDEKQSFFIVLEDNTLIYLDVFADKLYIENLDSYSSNQLFDILKFFSENNIYRNELLHISSSHLLTEDYSAQTDNSDDFLITLGNILIYYESASSNIYAENLGECDNYKITELIGLLDDHKISFIETE